MAFTHGVYTREVLTSLLSPVDSSAGLPVVVGTAPIHLGDISNVNKPQLVSTYNEAVELFGYSDDWEKYTLCEFMYSQFVVYGQSPCVLINVLDPSKAAHKSSVTVHVQQLIGTNKSVTLGKDILLANLEVTNINPEVDDEFGEGETPISKVIYTKDTDYKLEYNEEGDLVLSVVTGGALVGNNDFYVKCEKLKPENVSNSDIIGGVDLQTGKYTGLELISRVYPKFAMIPGLIVCPKFSESPEVAAIMTTKAQGINGLFSAMAIVDIPSDEDTGANSYSKVNEWKTSHSYNSQYMIACWPKVKLGEKIYHFSTHLAGLINSIDSGNEDIPYSSPSNHTLQIDSCMNASGKEIDLGLDEANILNSIGVVTALNWSGGWKAWGNRTAIYPSSTDVKDCFIPVRRMFNWLQNDFITTFWQRVDEPLNRRLVRTILNSYNVNLNGLAAREIILGGNIEFLDSENPSTNLLDGHLIFHINVTPATPAETIEGIFEFDVNNLQALFSD